MTTIVCNTRESSEKTVGTLIVKTNILRRGLPMCSHHMRITFLCGHNMKRRYEGRFVDLDRNLFAKFSRGDDLDVNQELECTRWWCTRRINEQIDLTHQPLTTKEHSHDH